MWVPINHPKELQREPQSVKATKSVAGKWKQTSDCFGTVRTKTIATAINGEQRRTTNNNSSSDTAATTTDTGAI